MYKTFIPMVALAAILTCSTSAAPAYPAPPAWQPDPKQREQLRRSLTLLETSSPAQHHTVRVLFYGQSITQQAWWKEVQQYLRTTYPNANLIIENRAIGGHSSQLLVKTAEADLYSFQPDLLIFHVYGSHVDFPPSRHRSDSNSAAPAPTWFSNPPPPKPFRFSLTARSLPRSRNSMASPASRPFPPATGPFSSKSTPRPPCKRKSGR